MRLGGRASDQLTLTACCVLPWIPIGFLCQTLDAGPSWILVPPQAYILQLTAVMVIPGQQQVLHGISSPLMIYASTPPPAAPLHAFTSPRCTRPYAVKGVPPCWLSLRSNFELRDLHS